MEVGLNGYRLPFRTWLVTLLESTVSIKRWLLPQRIKISNKCGTYLEESCITFTTFSQLRKLGLNLEMNSITTNQKMLTWEVSLTLSTRSRICNKKLMMERFRLLTNMKLSRDPRLNTIDLLIKKNKEKAT